MLAVISSGCGEKAVPASGAALDLQARFEEAFDDSKDYSTANGTIRFEPATEPTSETNIITYAIFEIIEETIGISETTVNNITNPTDNISVVENIIEETLQSTTISEHTRQEEQFVITPSGTRYHVNGCHTAKNISEYLTREEAKARGYEPCKICKP